jgi:nitroreductase
MTKLNDTSDLLPFLKSRKSASAKSMSGPGPTGEQLATILEIAARSPDHGKLAPWRFIVFEGNARILVGEALRRIWAEKHPEHGFEALEFQKGLLARAPVVVAVISAAKTHPKIPIWEQQLSAGAVCLNLEMAALGFGFDVQWQTDWPAYDSEAKAMMGLESFEQVAGFIYIGTSTVELEDRPRPDMANLVTYWTAP